MGSPRLFTRQQDLKQRYFYWLRVKNSNPLLTESTIMIWTLKKCNKKMGSPRLFTRQQALKLGYFYWVRVKNSNPLLTESSFCYLKRTNVCLEYKASFIQISSIASFNSFWIAWLRGYCTFSDSSVVSLTSSPWPKYNKYESIFPKKIIFYYQTFFLPQKCSLLDCS